MEEHTIPRYSDRRHDQCRAQELQNHIDDKESQMLESVVGICQRSKGHTRTQENTRNSQLHDAHNWKSGVSQQQIQKVKDKTAA